MARQMPSPLAPPPLKNRVDSTPHFDVPFDRRTEVRLTLPAAVTGGEGR